eukprot:SAG11_NODE_1228_length_5473_cov_3.015445_1_plen_115_part_00
MIPNRQLVGLDKLLTEPTQTVRICVSVTDADVAMVDDAGARIAYAGAHIAYAGAHIAYAGAHIAYAGAYSLTFFDGANKISVPASVATTRTVATIPPVDNPQPICCMGNERSCC